MEHSNPKQILTNKTLGKRKIDRKSRGEGIRLLKASMG